MRSSVVTLVQPDAARGASAQLRGRNADSNPVVDLVPTVERRLDLTEDALRSLVEDMPQVVFTMVGGRTESVSASVQQVCGFSPADVLSHSGNFWIDRVHGEDVARVHAVFNGLTANSAAEAEYRWLHKNGAWIWPRGRFRRGRTHAQIVGVLTDTSTEKRMREELQQLQKIAALGQCTAGIAHDFNNLLGVILASGTFLTDALAEADPRRADAAAIVEAAERAVALVRRLLSFSRRRPFEPTVFDLNRTIAAAADMFQRLVGATIELELSLDDQPCLVSADPNEIEQVLVNLVVNARDAMPDGGRLSIATLPVALNAKELPVEAAREGSCILLTVTDTGCGMPAETKGRIFEPFFTTKAQGHGTGLGLSTCHDIVTQAGGRIWVESEPGTGSLFTVCLPRVDASGVKARGPAAVTTTVLVVEDDDRLRHVVDRSLRRANYRVLQARDGVEALAVAASHEGPVHLIISDVVLADRSGPDVVADVRSRMPTARALFMSGHTQDGLVRQGTLASDAHFIQKPFSPDALAAAVKEVLCG